MLLVLPITILLTLVGGPLHDLPGRGVSGWPADVTEIRVTSSLDGHDQRVLIYTPEVEGPVPLLIGLHTWSANYLQTNETYGAPYAEWCIEHGWAFASPNFRGPNRRPEAAGSDAALQDVLDAVRAVERRTNIDSDQIALVGVSGGGHLALLLAARFPHRWSAVSAWVPITDLAAWHAETKRAGQHYWRDIEAACGGPPIQEEAIVREYRRRSPLTLLRRARGQVPIDIHAGIRDGHSGSVPISHSLHAFNLLAAPRDRISQRDIRVLVDTAEVPLSLSHSWSPRLENGRRVLFRRQSETARLSIFDGGHEIVTASALQWLAGQIAPEEDGR